MVAKCPRSSIVSLFIQFICFVHTLFRFTLFHLKEMKSKQQEWNWNYSLQVELKVLHKRQCSISECTKFWNKSFGVLCPMLLISMILRMRATTYDKWEQPNSTNNSGRFFFRCQKFDCTQNPWDMPPFPLWCTCEKWDESSVRVSTGGTPHETNQIFQIVFTVTLDLNTYFSRLLLLLN